MPDVPVTKSLIDNYFMIAARAVLVEIGIASFAFEHRRPLRSNQRAR